MPTTILSVEVDVREVQRVQRAFSHLGDVLTPAIAAKLTEGVIRIHRRARQGAPVDRGRLRSSIVWDVRPVPGGGIMGRVGTNVKYALYVEEGTRPHFVPFSVAPDLVTWINRHGMKAEPVGEGRYDIMIRGTNTIIARAAKGFRVSGKAQPFLKPAYDAEIDSIIRGFKDLGIKISKEAIDRAKKG